MYQKPVATAPQGEYSFAAQFAKMARRAKRYIYLEDQFAFYAEALAIAAEALPHVEAVIIVTDNATSFSYDLHGYDITATAPTPPCPGSTLTNAFYP